MSVIKVGSRVRALVRLTEEDVDPDPSADECEPGWLHAEPGDCGEVLDVRNISAVGDDDGEPEVGITVRFDKSGTATMCFLEEVEPD